MSPHSDRLDGQDPPPPAMDARARTASERTRRRVGGALTAALAATMSACAAGPSTLPADSSEARGHSVAQAACAGCHAVEPARDSPHPKAPGFGSLEMRHTASLEGRVAQLTREGHYGMAPVSLTPGELSDLLSYMGSLDTPPRSGR